MSAERRLLGRRHGAAIDGGLSGAVRLVTAGAAWVTTERGPRLLSADPRLLGPLSVAVAPPGDLHPGDRVRVEVRGAPALSPRPPARAAGARPGDRPDLGDGKLMRGVELLGRGRVADAAAMLAGRGPGLTPSGDDVLAGYLLMSHALAVSDLCARRTAAMDALRGASAEPSLSIVDWAGRGESFAVAIRIRDAVLRGRPAAARRMAGTLGAETGTAMLAGMLVARWPDNVMGA